jgi:hypothetical protein
LAFAFLSVIPVGNLLFVTSPLACPMSSALAGGPFKPGFGLSGAFAFAFLSVISGKESAVRNLAVILPQRQRM